MSTDWLVWNLCLFIDHLNKYPWDQYKNTVEGLEIVSGEDELIDEGKHSMCLKRSLEDSAIKHLYESQACETKY